jgi:putative inorganic carbon (hco3(-)) transporter
MRKLVARTRLAACLLASVAATTAFLLAVAHQGGLRMLLALVIAPAVAATMYLIWPLDPAYTLSAAIFLSPFSGNWGELGFPSGVDPDRLLLVLGVVQVALRAPAMRTRPQFRFSVAHVLLALATACVVTSAFIAGTLSSKADLFKIIDAFGILPFLVFLTAPLAFRTRHHRDILLRTLVALGAYLSLTALFEMVHLNALVFPTYILDPNYGIHFGRGRGPFVDAVANGFACSVCAAACGVAVATWPGVRRRIIAATIGVLCITGTFLSLERSVWIGTAAGLALAMLTMRRLRPYVLPLAAGIVIALIAVLALVPGLRGTVASRISSATYDRQNLTVAGVNMIKARPLTGFGWGQFQNNSLLYFRQSQNYLLTDENLYGLHNFLLTYAVELGLPGATLWALGLLTGVGSALLTRGPPDLQFWRRALVAVLVLFLVVANSIPPTEFPNLSLWLLAGVAFSGRYARSWMTSAGEMPASEHSKSPPTPRPSATWPPRGPIEALGGRLDG